MKADIVIKNGLICTNNGIVKGAIAAKDGIITAIGSDNEMPESEKTYDAKGLLVMPGVIEPHCHLGLDKNPDGSVKGVERYYEDVKSESQAAAVGGVTVINTTVEGNGPNGVKVTGVKNKINNAKGAIENAYVDMRYYLGVGNDGEVDEFNELRKEGFLSTAKFFLGYKGASAKIFGHPEEGYTNDFIYRAFTKLASQPGPVKAMIHCEDPDIMKEVSAPIEKEEPIGCNYIDIFNRSHPGVCEVMDLCKVAYIGRLTGCPVYIVHISAKETVEQLEYFLSKGFDITGETCLHYLMFSTEDKKAYTDIDWNHQAKVNPPIRTMSDKDMLWEGIRKGIITCIGTDTTNYSYHTNAIGGDFWKAQPGCGDGMSVLMTAMYSEGVNKGKISINEFVKLMSENPARALGMYPQKGALKVGADLDAVIFDPHKKWTFDSTKTYSTHEGSLYDGMEFTGKPMATFVRGNLVAENGKIVAEKPLGEFVKVSSAAV
ncbi:MAG: amidohydrolase family protein [Firmicutes bacterium]|nr:amidohydrolase family protein [Bacillota bacterium]